MDDVCSAAERFRHGIEASRDGWPDLVYLPFKSFPAGTCWPTTVLLADYFAQCGLGRWDQYRGARTDRQTHAWLERDGVLVDITADQFPGRDPVIVTRDRSWHHTVFPSAQGPEAVRLADIGNEPGEEARALYAVICRYLR
ncbi:hypothetical protein [Streptomyces sp. A5-4]|uniref:hypothetical protein n=1 Tax=Streptomyces sp. A5-4 TaxID=3384771 RepID=UPI003DA8C281